MESHSKNQGGILSKMEMSYVTDLPEGILIKFLQNLNPEDVQSFCTNERILKLCQNDTTLKQLLIDAFTTTIIEKYSPLEPYLHSDVYISKVNERLRKVIDEIEHNMYKHNIHDDGFCPSELVSFRLLCICLMGLKLKEFENLHFKSKQRQCKLLEGILTWVHQYGDIST